MPIFVPGVCHQHEPNICVYYLVLSRVTRYRPALHSSKTCWWSYSHITIQWKPFLIFLNFLQMFPYSFHILSSQVLFIALIFIDCFYLFSPCLPWSSFLLVPYYDLNVDDYLIGWIFAFHFTHIFLSFAWECLYL